MTVADTDVLIDFLTGSEPGASRVGEAIGRGTLRTTAVSRFELLAGARGNRQSARLRRLLESVPALALGTAEADRAAEVRRSLQGRGLDIGMADSLIAGIVLVNGGTLLTRNRRHFERVEGLALADVD